MSTDHSQPKMRRLKMMNTKARETSRLPAGSIGTGRHSASSVKTKNIDTPSITCHEGGVRNAGTAAAATTGMPAATTARTNHRSRGGSARSTPFVLRIRVPSFRRDELAPAGAGTARDSERDDRGDRNGNTHTTSIPAKHRIPPPVPGGHR